MNPAKEAEIFTFSLQCMIQRDADAIFPVDLEHLPRLQFLSQDLLDGRARCVNRR